MNQLTYYELYASYKKYKRIENLLLFLRSVKNNVSLIANNLKTLTAINIKVDNLVKGIKYKVFVTLCIVYYIVLFNMYNVGISDKFL